MSKTTSPFERALEQLRANQPGSALAALLDAWRELPMPALAEQIERLDAQLVRVTLPPALGGNNKQDAWRRALAETTPETLSPLFDTVVEGTQPHQATQRLELLCLQLGQGVRDPRLARRGWAWMREVPIPGRAARGFYERLGAVLIEIDDSRWDAEVIAADEGAAGLYTRPRLRHVGVRTGLAAFVRLAAHVRGRGALPEPDAAFEQRLAELERLVDQLVARGSEQTEAALLASVYAAPGDDEPRAIYADFLQQRGDPRGEFIALQLERARTDVGASRRERSLEKQYGRQWVGALAPFILASGRSFRRGFLAACRYKNDRVDRNPFGLAEWATIESIDVGPHVYMSGSAKLLLQPQLSELRVVHGLAPEDFAQICAQARPLAIEELAFYRGRLVEIIAALDGCTCLPKLRVLHLGNLGGVDDAGLERLRAIRATPLEFVPGAQRRR